MYEINSEFIIHFKCSNIFHSYYKHETSCMIIGFSRRTLLHGVLRQL